MPVENGIVKVQKRNRSLVRFDADRIRNAILRAGKAVGGFHQDLVPEINERLLASAADDETIAEALSDSALLCGKPAVLPSPDALRDYPGFLDERIRLERLRRVLSNTIGLSRYPWTIATRFLAMP